MIGRAWRHASASFPQKTAIKACHVSSIQASCRVRLHEKRRAQLFFTPQCQYKRGKLMVFRAFWPLIAASILLATVVGQPRTASSEPYFQGPKSCLECHKTEYKVWEGTKHYKSFRTAHKAKIAKKIMKAPTIIAKSHANDI